MDISLLGLTFAIGVAVGLRSLTPLCIVCWGAHRGWIDVEQTRLSFLASTAAAGITTLLALAELVADKLPFIPSRRSPGPLIARLLLGTFCGAALCVGWDESWRVGAAMGAIGALAGTFSGYEARTRLVKALKVPDYGVALTEDLITVIGAVVVVHSMVI